jgi:hypothetical protein
MSCSGDTEDNRKLTFICNGECKLDYPDVINETKNNWQKCNKHCKCEVPSDFNLPAEPIPNSCLLKNRKGLILRKAKWSKSNVPS